MRFSIESACDFLRTGRTNVQWRTVVSQKVHSERCGSCRADEDELCGEAAAVRYLGKHDRPRRRPIRIGYRKRRQQKIASAVRKRPQRESHKGGGRRDLNDAPEAIRQASKQLPRKFRRVTAGRNTQDRLSISCRCCPVILES